LPITGIKSVTIVNENAEFADAMAINKPQSYSIASNGLLVSLAASRE